MKFLFNWLLASAVMFSAIAVVAIFTLFSQTAHAIGKWGTLIMAIAGLSFVIALVKTLAEY